MPQQISFVVFEGFQSMALAAMPVFEYANVAAERKVYETSVLSEHGGLVNASVGLSVQTQPFGRQRLDTVIVGGGDVIVEKAPDAVIDFLRRQSRRARRTASICSGAFVLAQAGLLDGRRATTHWGYATEFRQRFSSVRLEEDRIFVADGNIWSSAGMTAGIDMALEMVDRDLGNETARRVAQLLVVYHRRAGGQSQHSALLEMAPKSDRVQAALVHARKNLAKPLSVEDLAEVASLSPRQFSRVFRQETGKSPAKAVEELRLEAARLLLERSRLTLDQVAVETGLTDGRRLREAFLRTYGQPPLALRRQARLSMAAA